MKTTGQSPMQKLVEAKELCLQIAAPR